MRLSTLGLAFYKADKPFIHKALRAFSDGPYSHCEVLLAYGNWIGACPEAGEVRIASHTLDTATWDFMIFDAQKELTVDATSWAVLQCGKRFDYLGQIRSRLYPRTARAPRKVFSSEFCILFLQQLGKLVNVDPYSMDPNKLFKFLQQNPELLGIHSIHT